MKDAAPLVYFKNRFIPADQALISIDDRSFRFGDGVFETLLVYQGQIYEFTAHLERLQNGLNAFKIAYDLSELKTECEELIQHNDLHTGYLRIIISRGVNGPGAIGYKPKNTQAYLIIQSIEKDLPEYKSIKLWISPHRAYYKQASKVNSAALYTMSMIEAEENNCDNALILNTEDEICETANGNIWWFKGDTLYTPSLDLPLVPGTVRKKLLELYEGKVVEGRFHVDVLKEADEVFMTNIGGLITSVSAVEPFEFNCPQSSKSLELRDLILADIKNTNLH